MPNKKSDEKAPIIVIKREEGGGGGHHGGAWKVAYADFVTAMMAFFLVMWLINATTEVQRRGLADYFSPTNALGRSSSGSGQPLSGKTPFDAGSLVSDKGTVSITEGNDAPQPETRESDRANAKDRNTFEEPNQPSEDADKAKAGDRNNASDAGGGGQAATPAVAPVQAAYLANAGAGTVARPDPSAYQTGQIVTPPTLPGDATTGAPGVGPSDPAQMADKALRAELDRRERTAMAAAAQELQQAVAGDPTLADLTSQLKVEMTPEGLRIQLLDADRTPMFATGSTDLEPRARALLQKVAGVVAKMTQHISVTGHTDSVPYKGGTRTNWDLSADRANATRRLLTEAGVADSRVTSVSGHADREPLVATDPLASENRRIAIVVLRDAALR